MKRAEAGTRADNCQVEMAGWAAEELMEEAEKVAATAAVAVHASANEARRAVV